MKKYFKLSVFIFITCLFAGCGLKKEVLIAGKTMGTVYHIKIVTWFFKNLQETHKEIEFRLEKIDKSMSTFRKDSEISKFNALKQTGEKFYISDDFYCVMNVAKTLYGLTDGAWDGTVKPLVTLWGFNSVKKKKSRLPEKKEIEKLIPDIGFNMIKISKNRYLSKNNSAVFLDLASIAKGYAVDEIAALINQKGFNDFLVEIGGEVYASGLRHDGKPWKVGINSPFKNAPYDRVYKIVPLCDMALATSGDYRNFFEIDKSRYSHVLDPSTGYPVQNGVISVSVMTDTCTFADGLATAVMVLGHKKGLDLVNKLDRVECLIVVREKDGNLKNLYSKRFPL